MAYFHAMSRFKVIALMSLLFSSVLFSAYVFTSANAASKPEAVTLALRAAGHQLLIASKNKTSRVLPVLKSREGWYQIAFDTTLSIMPDSLVTILNGSLQAAAIPTDYWAEVKSSGSDEVVYSYLMSGDENASIIPCTDRSLPIGWYTMNVKFASKPTYAAYLFPSAALLTVLVLSVIMIGRSNKKNPDSTSLTLGNYQLKKEDRRLVHKDRDMSLTEKEIELLMLFSSRQNQIIPREELQREIWESKGVIVGRSLDTYVSKLRKKLDKDRSVTIRNIHGAGYKLEVRK